jgi:hypothetical protein
VVGFRKESTAEIVHTTVEDPGAVEGHTKLELAATAALPVTSSVAELTCTPLRLTPNVHTPDCCNWVLAV